MPPKLYSHYVNMDNGVKPLEAVDGTPVVDIKPVLQGSLDA
jgi:tRNA (Thr-GGU) A37 N-methylase